MTASGWRSDRLKHVASVAFSSVDKKSLEGEVAVRLCNYTDVYYNGEITADLPFMGATASHDQVGLFGLRAGDVLITKDSETADDIGVAALVPETLDGVVCGYHLAVLRPKLEKIDPKYLFWSVCGEFTRGQMSALASGVTRYGLRFGDVGSLQLFVPDLATQRAVATFLDRGTARIDRLIDKKMRMADGGRTRFEAIRRRSVLGMVGRIVAKRPEHAVDATWWPQHIPATWEVARLMDLVELTNGFPFDSERFSDDSGFPLIRIRDLLIGETNTYFNGPVPSEAIVQDGDLLVGMDGDFNSVVWHGGTSALNQRLCRLRARPPIRDSFLAYLLPEPLKAMNDLTYFTTVKHLSSLDLLRQRLPLPPLEEQDDLVATLDRERALADDLIARLQRQVGFLREHRQALITAAVTGEVDVLQ